MPGGIPCSVNLLTHNSAATLEAALASVSGFAEIVIGDGHSTDATRQIAARYGCRVVDQDPRYTDGTGRLVDYAGARLQLLAVSSYDWVLKLDSDEVLAPGAETTIAGTISAGPPPHIAGYRLQGKHVLGGTTIEDEAKAPMAFPRLFRRSAVVRFLGPMDEGVEFAPGCALEDLDAVFLIPLPPVRLLFRKSIRYLRLLGREATSKGPGWIDPQLPRRRSAIRWLVRGWRDARRRGHPGRMPFRYEAVQLFLAVGIYTTLWLTRQRQRLRVRSRR